MRAARRDAGCSNEVQLSEASRTGDEMPLDSSQQEAKVESERKGALTAIIRVAGGVPQSRKSQSNVSY